MNTEDHDQEIPIDNYDLNKLMYSVLTHAMDDYVKLQHPKTRTKKYMQEAFNSAVDMFFDKEFCFEHFLDDEGKQISFKEFVSQLMSDDRIDLEKIKQRVINDAHSFWQNKFIYTIEIPESLIYNGHVYSVLHVEDNEDAFVDFDNKLILINKDSESSDNQELFMQLVLQVVSHHEDLKIPLVNMTKLGSALFRLLRMNSCFVGE